MGERLDIKETIAVINQMRTDGIIGEYAVGGAFAAVVHRVEVDSTDDVDVYIVLNPLPGQSLVCLDPIHKYLEARGYRLNRDGHPVIANWQVQFLPANEPLLKEALDECVESDIDGVPLRVMCWKNRTLCSTLSVNCDGSGKRSSPCPSIASRRGRKPSFILFRMRRF